MCGVFRWTCLTQLRNTRVQKLRLSYWLARNTARGHQEIGLLKDHGCLSVLGIVDVVVVSVVLVLVFIVVVIVVVLVFIINDR